MNPYDVIELMHRMTEDDIDIIRKEFWPTVDITEKNWVAGNVGGVGFFYCECEFALAEKYIYCPNCGSRIIWNV